MHRIMNRPVRDVVKIDRYFSAGLAGINMAHKILIKKQLDAFVTKLRVTHDVFAPTVQGAKTVWEPLEDAGALVFDFTNTDASPKDFLFPQTECMMRFVNSEDAPEGMIMKPEPLLKRPRALFNVRPCDAKAFEVLDRIFFQDEATDDTYWRDKRAKTLLLGLACNDPCPECFCTSMNCGPHHEAGLDVLFTDLGDTLLAKGLTERGKKLISDLPDAKTSDESKAKKLKNAAEKALNADIAMDKIQAREVMELFEAPLWDRVHETCLNCGACTFCCPTCHCFDIQDETQGDRGRRVRNWDTCMSWLFTQHASGHNPHATKKDRVRQRFMHKFKYIPMRRDNEIGCVGCGRCVRLCPVNIDVREVVREMNS